jgi:dUTP pyrophosphatase
VTDPGIPVAVLRLDPGLPLPAYAHPGDAGADLMTTVDVTLAPGERALVPTGISIAFPEGYVALVHPRSGLAARHGLSLVNTPGTIDAGYRGEIKVLLVNHDLTEAVELRRGDRVAQLVFQRVERAVLTEVDALPESVRGIGGYGSTGGSAGLGEPSADYS